MRTVRLLSLLLPLHLAAQPAPRPSVQVAKPRVAVVPPRLHVQIANRELVLVDLAGNGIELSGDVRTSLVTGSLARMRWTALRSDDAIVVLDATALRSSGWSVVTGRGEPLDASFVPRGGLRLTDPSGASFAAANALDLLARLDGNRDGRLDTSDPAWAATALFRDQDGDGRISGGELTRAEEMLRSISIAASGSEATDAFGSSRVPATAHLRDGTAIAIAYARPAAIE